MSKFAKLYEEFYKDGLKPAEQVALTHMYNRYCLSDGNNNFYDKDRHAYYITYSRQELAKLLNVSENTVTNVFTSLIKKGWIVVKRRFNSSNRIFLTKHLKTKDCEAKTQNLYSIKTKHINTKYTNTNKIDTSASVKKVSSAQSQDNKAIEKLANSLIIKSGISPKAVEVMTTMAAGNSTTLYNYAQMFFLAKKMAYKNNAEITTGMRSLEKNKHINKQLEKSINAIMKGANAQNVNLKGYLFASFRDLIECAINKFSRDICGRNVINTHQAEVAKTAIPMVKLI